VHCGEADENQEAEIAAKCRERGLKEAVYEKNVTAPNVNEDLSGAYLRSSMGA
jgi:hypothetical protein